ncbi:hypothetical protein AFLA_001298 [Aspergillus flavus NRRL3357]|nr:hypothetical protein AFLA_001298 [Aspergillus flavus NRRL3357]
MEFLSAHKALTQLARMLRLSRRLCEVTPSYVGIREGHVVIMDRNVTVFLFSLPHRTSLGATEINKQALRWQSRPLVLPNMREENEK